MFCEGFKLKINAVNEQNQYLSTFMRVMKREFTVITDSLHQDRKQTYCYQRYSRPRQRVYCYQRYSRPRQKESLLLSKIVYTKTERQFTVIKDILHLPKLTVYCYRRYSTPRQSLLLSKILYTKTEFTVIENTLHQDRVYCYRRYSTPRQSLLLSKILYTKTEQSTPKSKDVHSELPPLITVRVANCQD